MADPTAIRTVEWRGDSIRLIDQCALPARFEYVDIRDWRDAVEAIRTMIVRGAPAIGCTAALAMVLAAGENRLGGRAAFLTSLARAADALRNARPTAVNLFWAVDKILGAAERTEGGAPELAAAVERAAIQLLAEDLASNQKLGRFGAALMPASGSVLTHCNAGALCASGYGTALGVVRAAVEAGKRIHVYADETRPRLQGMKLTAWELQQEGIPVTVIADSMAAVLMREGKVDCVVVGADRIAANGDTANKIGTYGLAVAANYHRIPFYVAAPISSVDLHLGDGSAIPIEERAGEEITHIDGAALAPEGIDIWNPAFDVTPHHLISAFITDAGIAPPPFGESLLNLRERGS